MATNRKVHKSKSNNEDNPNKNICALRVAQYLRVDEEVHYLHTIDDLVRASRNQYTVRSRMSKVEGLTVGGARRKFKELAKEVGAYGFIIRVNGHALFVDYEGQTVVDTASRKRDARKITHCYIVY